MRPTKSTRCDVGRISRSVTRRRTLFACRGIGIIGGRVDGHGVASPAGRRGSDLHARSRKTAVGIQWRKQLDLRRR
jgi:hypothetical protein